MKIQPDHQLKYVTAGSAECRRLCRKPDLWLKAQIEADRAILRAARAETQHIKSVKRLEREAAALQREREIAGRSFRVRANEWGEDRRAGFKAQSSRRAVRIGTTKGLLPTYGFVVRTSEGLLLPFMRTTYSNAKNSKQGRAKHLVHYGADGAFILADGRAAFASSVGMTVDETAEAFDQNERVNRSAAKNAKCVHHTIIQSLWELTPEEQFAMAVRYCEQTFGNQDLPYSVALHPPSDEGDQRNWHIHIVYSYRPMVRIDEGEWQIGRFLRTDLDCPEQWTRMRFLLAEELNHSCEKHGIAKRYTHLSYAAAGVDFIPQSHLGAGLTAKVRRGEEVQRNVLNHRVVARNTALHVVREFRSALLDHTAILSAHIRRKVEAVKLAAAVASASPGGSEFRDMVRGIDLPACPVPIGLGYNQSRIITPANDRGVAGAKLSLGFSLPSESDLLPPALQIDVRHNVNFKLPETGGEDIPAHLASDIGKLPFRIPGLMPDRLLKPLPKQISYDWRLPDQPIVVPAALKPEQRVSTALQWRLGSMSASLPVPIDSMTKSTSGPTKIWRRAVGKIDATLPYALRKGTSLQHYSWPTPQNDFYDLPQPLRIRNAAEIETPDPSVIPPYPLNLPPVLAPAAEDGPASVPPSMPTRRDAGSTFIANDAADENFSALKPADFGSDIDRRASPSDVNETFPPIEAGRISAPVDSSADDKADEKKRTDRIAKEAESERERNAALLRRQHDLSVIRDEERAASKPAQNSHSGLAEIRDAQNIAEQSMRAGSQSPEIQPRPLPAARASRFEISPAQLAAINALRRLDDHYNSAKLDQLRRQNHAEDMKKIGVTSEVAGHSKLQQMNCDELFLCSSSFKPQGYKFLDDSKLTEEFSKFPQALLRPEIQKRLTAIMFVQQAKRDWILAAIAAKRIKLEDNTLSIPDAEGKVHAGWLTRFLMGQLDDPEFARQIQDAQSGLHRGNITDLKVRPEMSVWRKALADGADHQDLAPYIADELFRTSDPDERDALFKTTTFEEAEKLRRTAGLFAQYYKGRFYRPLVRGRGQFHRHHRVGRLNDKRRDP